ncbi:DnaJ domain-containing protein [Plectosphaerella cucumerina]|uniref:DnaJ domain-containing protein n=1 Tax=Plectosphaerella cucumerina TaxID=40658 RepID=A0A8K0TN85_9PEZI|nr:DnaJ domain-containing protein [Plectosphaerella cucumerina]
MHFRSLKRPQLVSKDHHRRPKPYPNPRRSLIAARQHTPDSDSPPWPCNPCPSPHEILGAVRGSAYSKSQFYRLVKLYHPDLAGDVTLNRAARIERYRLVIGANELLSNPERRRLYEQHGVGWVFPGRPSASARAPGRRDGGFHHQWSPGWEESAAAAAPQTPIFASNAAMAMFIVALAFAGAIVQLERARRAQWAMRLGDTALQDAISRDLEGLAHRLEGKPRELRILEFLARRQFGVLRDGGDGVLGDLEDNVCRH